MQFDADTYFQLFGVGVNFSNSGINGGLGGLGLGGGHGGFMIP